MGFHVTARCERGLHFAWVCCALATALATGCKRPEPPPPAPAQRQAAPPAEPPGRSAARAAIRASPFAPCADVVERALVPGIGLVSTRHRGGALKGGASKLGGLPDAPEGMKWPRAGGVPLAFLGQVRLEDAAPFDTEHRLPSTGSLLFFYDAKEQPWGFSPGDRGHWRVVHVDAPVASLRPLQPPADLPRESNFAEAALTLDTQWHLPASPPFDPLHPQACAQADEAAWDSLRAAVARRVDENTAWHHLLGEPQEIQGDMKLECQLASSGIDVGASQDDPRAAGLAAGAVNWTLLLQLDSDESGPGWMWGDLGRLYFWIRRDDLRHRRFDDVWLVLQCY